MERYFDSPTEAIFLSRNGLRFTGKHRRIASSQSGFTGLLSSRPCGSQIIRQHLPPCTGPSTGPQTCCTSLWLLIHLLNIWLELKLGSRYPDASVYKTFTWKSFRSTRSMSSCLVCRYTHVSICQCGSTHGVLPQVSLAFSSSSYNYLV